MRDVHFGKIIRNELRRQGISVTAFAQEMHCDRSNMYKLFKQSHLDSGFILRASVVLHRDLFALASEELQLMG